MGFFGRKGNRGEGNGNSASSHSSQDEESGLLRRAIGSVSSYTGGHHPIVGARSVLADFFDFIQQGNMIDLAIGLILGQAFQRILNSFVVDILTPVISLFSERSISNYYYIARCPNKSPGCDVHTWETWDEARDAGAVTINYGLFAENVINFLINALFLYVTVKQLFEWVFKRNIVTKKQCQYCKEFVKGSALVCKNCGSTMQKPEESQS